MECALLRLDLEKEDFSWMQGSTCIERLENLGFRICDSVMIGWFLLLEHSTRFTDPRLDVS